MDHLSKKEKCTVLCTLCSVVLCPPPTNQTQVHRTIGFLVFLTIGRAHSRWRIACLSISGICNYAPFSICRMINDRPFERQYLFHFSKLIAPFFLCFVARSNDGTSCLFVGATMWTGGCHPLSTCVYLCARSLIYGGPLVNIGNLLKSWRTVISHRFWVVFWCPHSMSVHWSVGILHVVLKSLKALVCPLNVHISGHSDGIDIINSFQYFIVQPTRANPDYTHWPTISTIVFADSSPHGETWTRFSGTHIYSLRPRPPSTPP